ncbi:hypothetical protein T09_7243 [Trichinella sp. T9]|nr:hypothetical protein T09_7243 [Trichinella sp. T9]
MYAIVKLIPKRTKLREVSRSHLGSRAASSCIEVAAGTISGPDLKSIPWSSSRPEQSLSFDCIRASARTLRSLNPFRYFDQSSSAILPPPEERLSPGKVSRSSKSVPRFPRLPLVPRTTDRALQRADSGVPCR